MNIHKVLDTTSAFADQTYHAGLSFASWAGSKIQSGCVKYLMPVVEKLNFVALKVLRGLENFLERGPAPIFALAAGLFLAGVSAFKLADRKAYEEDAFAKTTWKTIGIACFLAATAVTSCGIIAITSTKFISLP